MFFSVIVPVYNVEKYLSECIDSILMQSFTDFELILVNDGSTDGSGQICDRYAESDNRINVIHKPNGGLSDARNAGTRGAQGEYIIYIDSDDYISSKDFFKSIYESVKGSDILLYKHQKFFDTDGQLLPCGYSYENINAEDAFVVKLRKLVIGDAFYGMAWIKAFRRELVIRNDIEFEVGLLGEDMDWNYHLITHAQSLAVIDEPFIAYRQRANSITTSIKLKNLTDFIYILEKWSKKIQEEIKDQEFKETLFGSMAKYYSNLLITYNRVHDKQKKEYIKRIKDLAWILKYAMSKRPKMVAKVYRIFGFGLTTKALKLIDKR